jgi:hypothetical protein
MQNLQPENLTQLLNKAFGQGHWSFDQLKFEDGLGPFSQSGVA